VYAQDSEIAWMDWDQLKSDPRRQELLAFARQVFAIRQQNPVLRRRTFFRGQIMDHAGVKDLTWVRADGEEMREEDWTNTSAKSLGMLVHGQATDETDDRGRLIEGATMLLLVNTSDDDVGFTLPHIDAGANESADRRQGVWTTVVDTTSRDLRSVEAGPVTLAPYSLLLLRFGRERRLAQPIAPARVSATAASTAV
jgi:glycogen operon protein